MWRSLLAVLGGTLLVGPTHGSKPQSIEGVWQAVQVSITAPSPRIIPIPAPRANLTILTATHYSRVEVHAEGARPTLSNPANATAEELRAAWGPLFSEAGIYDISGNVITLRPIVAKNPDAMASGAFTSHTFRLQGDTLWVTPQRSQHGPVSNPATIKLVRVE
ncbi:MAG: hypothetical protein ABJE10_14655 [bacterium]